MVAVKRTLKRLINGIIPDRYFVSRVRDPGVVLTFDDGPNPQWTQRSLDVMDELGVKVTYFLVGQEAERHAGIVREIVERGHTVGDHTYSHRAVAGLGTKELELEVLENRKRLSDISGQDVRLFRPPWGKIDIRSAGYLMLKGLRIVMWSVDSTDYKKVGADDIMATIDAADVRAGDIVLMHDDNEYSIAALPDLVATVRHKGLSFGNLSNR